MSETPLLPESIYFIKLPKKIDLGLAELLPEIPLPVEVEQGQSLDISRLRPEMIVSAILRVLAAQPEHEHADYYRQIVRILYPNVEDELSREGIMRAREADFGTAQHIFSALAGFNPEEARHALNLAVLYEDWAASIAKTGDSERESALHEKAHSWYERLLQWEPPLADAFYNAAFFYAGQRNFPRAMSLFTTFISLTEDAEKRDKARSALEKLKERSSSDDLFKEAYDAIRLGNEDKSIALVQDFIQREPDVWNAWFLLGWAYRRKGRFSEGLEALERAISLGANMIDVYNEYSICAMELGKFKESRKHLELALRLEGENTKIISNLGVLAKKTGNLEEARGFFETVLEIDPEDQLAQNMLKALKE